MYKENIPLDDMILTPSKMNLGFFTNSSTPMMNVHPFILSNTNEDAHVSTDVNPSMDVEP